ncbi:MAG: hypothetical protein EZS28_009284 [Streblomastix strix]|uniref:Eukaryotic translation initiation factor 3 subunit G N-terminal domain-containing protein n=1 Tax=Streblomastix strix TaxID=222440 RepID=A0A5J4WLE3_9EUKA|nr:MAG: hypothetical protein EZS28_009284 [Streblomastix strix]
MLPDDYELPDDIDKEIVLSREPQEDGSEIVKIQEKKLEGNKIRKTIRTFRKTVKQVKVLQRAIERKKRFKEKFGNTDLGTNFGEVIYLEPPPTTIASVNIIKSQSTTSGGIKCQLCGGNHFTFKCPEQAQRRLQQEQDRQLAEQMGGRSGQVDRPRYFDDKDDFMVRITNFPEGDESIDMDKMNRLVARFNPERCFAQKRRFVNDQPVVMCIFKTRDQALALMSARLVYDISVLTAMWSRRDLEREKKLKESQARR